MKNRNMNIRIVSLSALALGSAAFLALSVVSLVLVPPSADANEAPNGSYARKYLGQGDYVWNWDYNDNDDDEQDAQHVDWGMRYIFHNNAEIDYIKDRLDGGRQRPRDSA